jgi:hypothetical protein
MSIEIASTRITYKLTDHMIRIRIRYSTIETNECSGEGQLAYYLGLHRTMIPPAISFVDVAANISYRPLLEAADTDR